MNIAYEDSNDKLLHACLGIEYVTFNHTLFFREDLYKKGMVNKGDDLKKLSGLNNNDQHNIEKKDKKDKKVKRNNEMRRIKKINKVTKQ